jgi:hypothetical protein
MPRETPTVGQDPGVPPPVSSNPIPDGLTSRLDTRASGIRELIRRS